MVAWGGGIIFARFFFSFAHLGEIEILKILKILKICPNFTKCVLMCVLREVFKKKKNSLLGLGGKLENLWPKVA